MARIIQRLLVAALVIVFVGLFVILTVQSGAVFTTILFLLLMFGFAIILVE